MRMLAIVCPSASSATVTPFLDGADVVLTGPHQAVSRSLQRRGLWAFRQLPDNVLGGPDVIGSGITKARIGAVTNLAQKILPGHGKEPHLAGAEAGDALQPPVATKANALANKDDGS